MNFEKDIFVSYAHIDNESLVEGEKGWISEFHRSLEVRLSQLLGEKPKIWRDTSLDGNHRFNEEIVAQFKNIAILVSVITPRYVNSEWCIKELQEFVKAQEDNLGLFVNNKARIFKVVKTPVDLDRHPNEIKGLLGYDFFQIDNETKRVKELSNVFGPNLQQAYWSKLDDIAHDISSLLQELKQDESSSSAENRLPVYLAETSFDRTEERDRVKRWLTEAGCKVYPDQNLSLVSSVYTAEVKEALDKCKLSIHLIGKNYGIVPEGTEYSKVELQSKEAAKASLSSDLRRLFWRAKADDISDERQRLFLEDLSQGETLIHNADFIVGPLEEFKFSIEDSLEKFKKPKKTNEDALDVTDVSASQVYLICDERDLEDIVPIEDYLFDNGCNVIVPAFEGEQTELRIDHQENLKSCDGVLIYYGKGNDLWVNSKLRDLMKIAGYGRQTPLLNKIVVINGESTIQKTRFRSRDMSVVNLIKDPDLGQLEAFVKPLTQRS